MGNGRLHTRSHHVVWLSLALSLALVGACKKSAAPTGQAGEPGAAAAPPADGKLVLPALGAASDAIEPPSRDLLPGTAMTEAQAKPITVGKVEIEPTVDTDSGLVRDIQVTYPKADWEALAAKWGKPTFGEDIWLGANWLASLNGCASGTTCTVTFVRSPAGLLSAKRVPPLTLANLRAGMSPDEVKRVAGVALPDASGVQLGYAFTLDAEYDDDHLVAVTINEAYGGTEEWLPWLTKLWGAPVELGDDKVWLNPQDHWLVHFDAHGDLLQFRPMVTTAELLAKSGPASLLALAKAALGKPRAGLKLPGYDPATDLFLTVPTELSLRTTDLSLSTNDAEAVIEVAITLHADAEDGGKALEKALTAAWGPITLVKDPETEEEVPTIKVEGLTAVIEVNDDNVSIKLKR